MSIIELSRGCVLGLNKRHSHQETHWSVTSRPYDNVHVTEACVTDLTEVKQCLLVKMRVP